MRIRTILLLVGLIGTLAFTSPVYADLTGATVDAKAEFPTMGTVFQDGGTAVIGAGVEYPAGSFSSYNPNISIDLTGNQIFISLNGTSTFFLPAAFNGFEIDFLTGTLTGASVDASSNFNPAITIVGNDLFLNYQDLNASGVSVIDITGSFTSSVPEPASLLLLGSGLVSLMGIVRKRVKRT